MTKETSLLLAAALIAVPVLVVSSAGMRGIGLVGLAAALFVSLLRPEILLSAIFFGGPILNAIPLDEDGYTAALLGMRALFVFAVLLHWAGSSRSRTSFLQLIRDPGFLATATLAGLLFWGLDRTGAPEYGLGKARSFLVANLFLVAAPLAIAPRLREPAGLTAFLGTSLLLGSLVVAAGLAVSFGWRTGWLIAGAERFYEIQRLGWLGTGPVELARYLAAFAVVVVWSSSRRHLPLLPSGLLLAGTLYMLARTGTRGPALALALAPVLAASLLRRPRWRPRRLIATLAVSMAAVVTFLALSGERRSAELAAALTRTSIVSVRSRIAAGEPLLPAAGENILQDPSMRLREKIARASIEIMQDALPWGTGTGGYASALFGHEARIYPHNIEAEVLIEQGVPGLILLLVILALGIHRIRRPESSPWAAVLFLLALLEAQVSRDLPGNAAVWFWLSMMGALRPKGISLPPAQEPAPRNPR